MHEVQRAYRSRRPAEDASYYPVPRNILFYQPITNPSFKYYSVLLMSRRLWLDLTPDLSTPQPEPRARMAMAIIKNGKGLIIFGGYFGSFNEAWGP